MVRTRIVLDLSPPVIRKPRPSASASRERKSRRCTLLSFSAGKSRAPPPPPSQWCGPRCGFFPPSCWTLTNTETSAVAAASVFGTVFRARHLRRRARRSCHYIIIIAVSLRVRSHARRSSSHRRRKGTKTRKVNKCDEGEKEMKRQHRIKKKKRKKKRSLVATAHGQKEGNRCQLAFFSCARARASAVVAVRPLNDARLSARRNDGGRVCRARAPPQRVPGATADDGKRLPCARGAMYGILGLSSSVVVVAARTHRPSPSNACKCTCARDRQPNGISKGKQNAS